VRLRRSSEGFSLLEVLIAMAILALGCGSLTTVMSAVLRAQTAAASRERAETVLEAEARRLAAMPYWPAGGRAGAADGSLLAEVFPHADAALNAPGRRYEPGEGVSDGARFVSETTIGGLRVVRTARFCSVSGGDRTFLGDGALGRWSLETSASPPAAAVEVDLEVSWGSHVASRGILVTAWRATLAAAVGRVGSARAA
jgi:prepilin-type N-terminal cleavage/methylation domain-containing protein